ncbi:hypothetical protein QBC41DRAFT_335455 [Cercophora samala]|uniref:Protein kinase domain-containing protein n=1 Tax=Cercophora samala TaxID=330535 RepID=A0AA40DED0_9PEZI|nr:hypothetical protein QBC41DRAFT_335455 [Cercophora samala]
MDLPPQVEPPGGSDGADQQQQQQQQPDSNDPSHHHNQPSLWRRLNLFHRDKGNGSLDGIPRIQGEDDSVKDGSAAAAAAAKRISRKVVPGLPRAPTFKRQQSEKRHRLEPIRPTAAERRAVSMDRRVMLGNGGGAGVLGQGDPRGSAPDFLGRQQQQQQQRQQQQPFGGGGGGGGGEGGGYEGSVPSVLVDDEDDDDGGRMEKGYFGGYGHHGGFGNNNEEDDHENDADGSELDDDGRQSVTTSQWEAKIHDELEQIWILNLSMHFRDKSKREKFFVTYRQQEHLWRRVTVSLDYRNAPEGSLEMELAQTKFQREKSAKIYEAIRESLMDIQFYDSVTNLKLQTTDGRLHVHVVEDVNEIISYPSVRLIQHTGCRKVREREMEFDSHMSGFVYKMRVNGQVLIKKEIPGPDTVDEFLYEINALNSLRSARNVIQFYGVVVDDREEHVTGILISYAEQGALIDILYDHAHEHPPLPWSIREKWARQIVAGLSEIHEAGFVQGDFTLSNIVIDHHGDAKIIDINRRGCPVGWEPPEVTPMIECNQRISMYIGIKSDLYQLGMVLWSLATQDDEPEAQGRPLQIADDVDVPAWFARIVYICLSDNPRNRLQALQLLALFPETEEPLTAVPGGYIHEDSYLPQEYMSDIFSITSQPPNVMNGNLGNEWQYIGPNSPTTQPHGSGGGGGGGGGTFAEDPYFYPPRGRSPPSPQPSNHHEEGCEPTGGRFGGVRRFNTWSVGGEGGWRPMVPSVSDLPTRSVIGEESDVGGGFRRGRQRVSPRHGKIAVSDYGGIDGMVASQTLEIPKQQQQQQQGGGLGLGIGEKELRTPESRADSGKDMTELGSTPRDGAVLGLGGGKEGVEVLRETEKLFPSMNKDLQQPVDQERQEEYTAVLGTSLGRLGRPDDLNNIGGAFSFEEKSRGMQRKGSTSSGSGGIEGEIEEGDEMGDEEEDDDVLGMELDGELEKTIGLDVVMNGNAVTI